MNRIAAALLAIVGGAAIALGVLMVGTGAVGGLLWIFVFGDDSWPTGWEIVVTIIVGLIGFYTWLVAARHIWNRFKPLL